MLVAGAGVTMNVLLNSSRIVAVPPNGKSSSQGTGKPAPTAGKSDVVKWRILYQSPRTRRPGAYPLPENSLITSLGDLTLTGPAEGHPHLLGKFSINGSWGIVNGCLGRIAGTNAVAEVLTADEFEMEGLVQAEGTGGWFILFGWNGDSGHALFQMGSRTSGSPWYVCKFRDGESRVNSQEEIGRMNWKGFMPVKLAVREGTFNLSIGDLRLATERKLESYEPGRILIGTYDTQYGPRNVLIQSLRAKILKDAPKEGEKEAPTKKSA